MLNKKNRLCFAAVILLAVCVCASSCGDPYRGYAEKIAGTWTTEHIDPNRYELYVFNEDGTGRYSFVQDGRDGLGYSFTYTLEGNKLAFTADKAGTDQTESSGSAGGKGFTGEIRFTKDGLILTVSRVATEFRRSDVTE